MSSYDISVQGAGRIREDLIRFGERSATMRPVLERLAMLIYEEQEDLYASAGAAVGGWAPLKEATIAAKLKAGLDPRILHATLSLRNAITGLDDESLIRVTDSELRIGTSIPYFRYHATGSKDGTLPKREPAIFDAVMKRNVTKSIQRWIMDGTLPTRALR